MLLRGYKAFRISTIVDFCIVSAEGIGYKAFRISTIVDKCHEQMKTSKAIKPLEFLLL